MFGRIRKPKVEIGLLWNSNARRRDEISDLQRRIADLEKAFTVNVGDKSVSLTHAVQVLADAHDMQAVERHLRIKHHRQGDVQGRAINEW